MEPKLRHLYQQLAIHTEIKKTVFFMDILCIILINIDILSIFSALSKYYYLYSKMT